MQRGKFPIYNGTLKTFVCSSSTEICVRPYPNPFVISCKVSCELRWVQTVRSAHRNFQLIIQNVLYMHGAMETPQHVNVSTRKCLKNRFWGISVFWGEIPQNWKMLRDFRIFLRRFLIFKVEVFPLFFWGVSVFWKKF